MKPEHKERIQKWVNALRSGNYKQGTKVLKTQDNKFCCLGVACDIYSKETGEGEWRLPSDESYQYEEFVLPIKQIGVVMKPSVKVLPDSVRKYFDLRSNNPLLHRSPDESKILSLAELNDKGLSFNKIADLIENNFIL